MGLVSAAMSLVAIDVYVIDTTDGRLLARIRIRVGREPYDLCVWPQPGRYSLGHTDLI